MSVMWDINGLLTCTLSYTWGGGGEGGKGGKGEGGRVDKVTIANLS